MRLYFSKTKDGFAYKISKIIAKEGEKELVLPAKHNGLPVVGISNEALNDTCITSVIIPEGVTVIRMNMFSGCIYLTSVKIPNSVTYIGSGAFCYCRGLTNITIPDSVTHISECAFYGCKGLTNITIPNSVISIGSYAFKNCYNLTNVTFAENSRCSSIGFSAFAFCLGLTSITIPESVMYIGLRAFIGCTSLNKPGKFKATKAELTCRDYEFKIGEWSDKKDAILCNSGYHYCLNVFDVFNYYSGRIGIDIRVFEVETEGDSDQHHTDSKRVCERIKLTREIKSFAELLN